ncbi:3'-5' exonuclease [Membranihabitans maritimus]|uniref:3'-5' exonuclease n=1 Tax=Membranihabitans maritimus TaxID=2904244 RepID=UPI001F394DF1|nr:3'-5' exonuclease [Membranihabitans maritimus]
MYILFDIEATCWDGYHSNHDQEVIEIGGVKVDQFNEHISEFQSFVLPCINPELSFYCKSLTNISQEEINEAPLFEEVYDHFYEWVEPDVDTIFVSWGNFDRKILDAECERNMNEASFIQNHIDLRGQYAEMKGKKPKLGLMKALLNEGMEFDGQPHRAIPDTLNMMKIFKRYFGNWFIKSF